jgi:NAD(P)-dependent dehydrogenase (short-subunit alcohol dehydrogenase family)
MGKLSGKIAIVTGAASGIGRASALLFAREGASVAVIDRDLPGAKATVEEITGAGGKAIAVEADVSKSADVQRMIAVTIERFGRLDILYNNAGVMSPGLLHLVAEEEWHRVISINLTANFLACKYALPELMKHGGVILATASVAGLEGRTAHAAYCASKAGLINMIKNVAMDYAKYGIRANCLCPGGVATNISKEALTGLSDAAKERLAKWSGEAVPMARIAQPEELASAALFLCCDDSTFVTGTAMVVDGGSIAGHFIPLVE